MAYYPYTPPVVMAPPQQPLPQPQPTYQASPQPQIQQPTGPMDIICHPVTSETEVQNYFVGPNQNGMFMDINQMKVYTKDGSNGLIREFDLVESQESVQRYQQMKQIKNAEFPIVDATARDVSDGYSRAEMSEMEKRMDEKFDILQQHIDELSQMINKQNGTNNQNNQKKR